MGAKEAGKPAACATTAATGLCSCLRLTAWKSWKYCDEKRWTIGEGAPLDDPPTAVAAKIAGGKSGVADFCISGPPRAWQRCLAPVQTMHWPQEPLPPQAGCPTLHGPHAVCCGPPLWPLWEGGMTCWHTNEQIGWLQRTCGGRWRGMRQPPPAGCGWGQLQATDEEHWGRRCCNEFEMETGQHAMPSLP